MISKVEEVEVTSAALLSYRGLVSRPNFKKALELASTMGEAMQGRVVWNINSTAAGGGVAEMLHQLVGYGRGAHLDARWLVVGGNADFFRVTKRLHNALHGSEGSASPLGEAERAIYEQTTSENASEIAHRITARDVVILHDPQTAGLIPHLRATGALLIWRCHVGCDEVNAESAAAWAFLERYITAADLTVFSRAAYAPEYLDPDVIEIIAPSIDPFSPKNQRMPAATVRGILIHTGLIAGGNGELDRAYVRSDQTPRRVERPVTAVRTADPPSPETPLIVQVSRWDRLKDPIGVMEGFARYASPSERVVPELVLAGPQCAAVSDDPEGLEAFEEVVDAWGGLPHEVRKRVHLASIPMDDLEENAAIVNALQRHAAVVVQKSIREGFGLTVTEAMWKARPVIASEIGGIQDQIIDRKCGVLLHDPSDPDEFAAALAWTLADDERSAALGVAARERVRNRYLGLTSLLHWGQLMLENLDRRRAT